MDSLHALPWDQLVVGSIGVLDRRDATAVRRALAALDLQRQNRYLESAEIVDGLEPCTTRTGELTVLAVLSLASNDPTGALRLLSRVPASQLTEALRTQAERLLATATVRESMAPLP